MKPDCECNSPLKYEMLSRISIKEKTALRRVAAKPGKSHAMTTMGVNTLQFNVKVSIHPSIGLLIRDTILKARCLRPAEGQGRSPPSQTRMRGSKLNQKTQSLKLLMKRRKALMNRCSFALKSSLALR